MSPTDHPLALHFQIKSTFKKKKQCFLARDCYYMYFLNCLTVNFFFFFKQNFFVNTGIRKSLFCTVLLLY